MSLVNGKAVTLDRCISEIAEGNLTKIGRGHYVAAKSVCSKFRKIWRGVFPRRIPNMFILVWHFLVHVSQGNVQPKPLN